MSEDKFKLDTIESAIRDIRDGKVVIVVDDKNRENEGDFLAAAELITPEIINFMATHGRGLICAPITENISKRLGLNLMVGTNTPLHSALRPPGHSPSIPAERHGLHGAEELRTRRHCPGWRKDGERGGQRLRAQANRHHRRRLRRGQLRQVRPSL